jgi:CRP/FNR family transcriptional regulator, cyclic AMP receptor protein
MSEAERLGLFGAMNPALRGEAVNRSRLIRARKGTAILSKGDTSSDVFFVLEGRLQVLLYSANGREVSLRDLAEGDMFGEMAAIDGESRSASIIALDDSRLLAMSRPDFRTIIETSPEASMWLLGQLTARIRVLTERVFELSALNVQSRLHCELLRMAARSPTGLEVRPAPTHAELANRIGTHREAVTREMRALTTQNIIKTGRRRIQFVDIARLQTTVGRLSLQAAQAEKTTQA